MNTKKIYQTGLALASLLVVFSSCKKQLEIAPRQSIEATTALTSKEAIDASITSVYATYKSARLYGRDLIAIPEVLADNGFATNKSGRLLNEAANVQGAHFTGTVWSGSFAAINQINNTIAAISAGGIAPTPTQADLDRWLGQLYFLRGLYYFDLIRVYGYVPGAVVAANDRGGVPLSTTGIATSAAALAWKPSRAPIADVYAQIVKDLIAAESRLTFPGLGVNVANKAAAQALLSRVYLYSKDYTESKKWSDAVITLASSKLATTANYVAQWRGETHTETLFQIRFATPAENIGVNESLQTSFTTLVTPGNQASTGGFGDVVPTITLLNDLGITLTGGNTTTVFALNHTVASRSTDVRNLMFEPGTAGRGNIKVECTKYIGKNGTINLDNVPVLRISEAILNRAEAQATAGSPVLNLAGALSDLKALKARRYTDYTGSAQETADNAMTQAQLLEEILRQRRIEFAFEGHRFFDLKRLGRDLVKAPHYNTVAFTDIRILPALPQSDIDGNPNLKQNAGY
jgi:starch-binding outer membrane protein, SusD/RagB family